MRIFRRLNDIVIAKGALAKFLEFTLFVNDIEAAYIRGDGVIVSTPRWTSQRHITHLLLVVSIRAPGWNALLVTSNLSPFVD